MWMAVIKEYLILGKKGQLPSEVGTLKFTVFRLGAAENGMPMVIVMVAIPTRLNNPYFQIS